MLLTISLHVLILETNLTPFTFLKIEFIPNSSFLSESPRWLLSKGKERKAYEIVFNKKYDGELPEKEQNKMKAIQQEQKQNQEKQEKVNKFFYFQCSMFFLCIISFPLQVENLEPEKTKVQKMFKELSALYGPPELRRMAFICYYTWCVTALSYYVTGDSSLFASTIGTCLTFRCLFLFPML